MFGSPRQRITSAADSVKARQSAKNKKVIILFSCILAAFVVLGSNNESMLVPLDVSAYQNAFNRSHQDFIGNAFDTRQNGNSEMLMEATNDQIVSTLMKLAKMPAQDLQQLLEGEDGSKNPFQLDNLQAGTCPWSASETLPWLPKKKSRDRSQRFQSDLNSHPATKSNLPVVALYYEHLSKAGGTSFCKLAQSNMPKDQVPSYYCMPSSENGGDGRVGGWQTQRVEEYFHQENHRVVSSEWDPFYTKMQSHFSTTNNKVQLIFATTIRNPVDRFLSSYKFFGVVRRWGDKSKPPPTLEKWVTQCVRRSRTWKDKPVNAIFSNVCRFNFGVWKFSGGTLPISDANAKAAEFLKLGLSPAELQEKSLTEGQWKQPFEDSILALANFDLVIPMEELSQHTSPLTEVLGWTNFSTTHVVTTGKIINNKASSELPPKVYDTLWQSNSLDMILYYWSLAVYLTRVNCGDRFLK